MFRKRANKAKSHRQFRNRANKTHRMNNLGPVRGGIRL